MLGLCICYNNHNYGTMLQAYATTMAVERLGVPYEIIRYQKKLTPLLAIRWLPRVLNPILLSEKKLVLQKKLNLKRNADFAADSQLKDAAFDRFEKAYFKNFSPVFRGYRELCRQASRYDACLVGSDQLWSPAGLPTNFYNLMFVPDPIRRISYAASFGVSTIPFFQIGRTRRFLQRIEHLSVRENSAQAIVKQIAGKNARVVVDPTMLLSADEWAGCIPVSQPPEEPYLFAYFLGPNPEHRKIARQVADQLGVKLVALRHMDEFVPADEGYGDEAPFDVGPGDFLNLIRHARYICTDSFHGTVFSTLHHKQFIVFERFSQGGNSRNSRIATLCRNLGLEARLYSPQTPSLEQLTAVINYVAVEEKLATLRQQSTEFLQHAIKG